MAPVCRNAFALLSVLSCLGLGGGVAIAADRPDIQAYGRLPQVDALSMAPSGQVFAAVIRNDGGTVITVFDAATAKPLDSLGLGNDKFRNMMWIDDDRMVIIRSITASIQGVIAPKGEQYVALEYNFRMRRGRPLLMGTDRALNTVAGDVVRVRAGAAPAKLVLEGMNFPQDVTVLSLFEQGPTGKARVIAQGRRETADWIVGSDGTVLGEVRHYRSNGGWQVLVGQGVDQLKVVQEGTSLTTIPRFRGVSADSASVYVSIPDGDDFRLLKIETASGQVVQTPSDQGLTFLHEDGTEVIAGIARIDGDDLRYEWSDPRDQSLWASVQKAFGGGRVWLVSTSTARDRLILLVEGKEQGFSYFLLDRKTGQASFLSDAYRDIGPEALSERRYIRYKAGDGREIPAYLTLPIGRTAKALPLVVLPHGGPAARDDIGFDWWSQAYASLGYAVLQPQFRGSYGFGPDHSLAGDGEVGRRMQTDVSDGVDDLVRSGIADPARVSIVGASYGGYAALAGVTLQSGVYRCAVSVAGVSDWAQLLRDEAIAAGGRTRVLSVRYWRKLLAVADEKNPSLSDISPVFHAASASAPILLIHGADDTVVKIDHSTRMAAALKKAGKPVEMITLKGEDHWLSNGETRVQMLTESARFLKACNPPQGPGAESAAADR